jgi:cell division transport system ATP-binding protein
MARALIHDPELIIADEPTGNLDWENTQRVADLFINANREGKTVLLFTHDIHLLNYIKNNIEINLFKI